MNSTFLFEESKLLLGTNSTHINFTYVENEFAQYFYLSLFQTFTLVFLGELGDQIFILMIILELKSRSPSTLFFSSLLSFSIINTISIIIGSSLDLLLYQNFIDLTAIIIFTLTGINLFLKYFDYGNKTYEEEIFSCIKGEIENEELRKNVIRSHFYESSRRSGHFISLNNEELKEPLLLKKANPELKKSINSIVSQNSGIKNLSEPSNSLGSDKKNLLEVTKGPTLVSSISGNSIGLEIVDEPPTIFGTATVNIPDDFKKLKQKEETEPIEEFDDEDSEEDNKDTNYFWIFTKTLLITVFADSTQIGVLASSSIYNANGVIIGSFLAIFCICFLAGYYNDSFVRELKERNMCIINGFIFICLAMEVYYFSQKF